MSYNYAYVPSTSDGCTVVAKKLKVIPFEPEYADMEAYMAAAYWLSNPETEVRDVLSVSEQDVISESELRVLDGNR